MASSQRRGKVAAALVAAFTLGLAALAALTAIATDRSISLADLSKPASSLAASVKPSAHKKAPLAALSPAMSALDRAKELKTRTEWLDSEDARLQGQVRAGGVVESGWDVEEQRIGDRGQTFRRSQV